METRSLLLLVALALCGVLGYQPNCRSTDLIFYVEDSYRGFIANYLDGAYMALPNTRFADYSNDLSDWTYSLSTARTQLTSAVAGAGVLDVNRLSGLWDKIVAKADPAHRIIVLVATDKNAPYPDGIPQALNFLQMMKDNSTFDITFIVYTLAYAPHIGKIASEPTSEHVFADPSKFAWGFPFATGTMNYTSCTLMGDSRVSTFDGASYIFNGLGEYTLVSTTSYDVFVRMMPCTGISPGTYSCVQALTVSTPLVPNCMATVNYDRETNTISTFRGNSPSDPRGFFYNCGSGVDIRVQLDVNNNADNTNTYAVDITISAIAFQMSTINAYFGQNIPGVVSVNANYTSTGATNGLCGVLDGCKENDLFTSNGNYLDPNSPAQDIYQQFALSWVTKKSPFTYGPNEAEYIKYYANIAAAYTPSLTTLTNPTAASACGYFADKSQYLYDSCTTAYSTGFIGVTTIYEHLLDQACKAYCTSRVYSNFAGYPASGPNVMVNTEFCAPRCDYGNTIDLHQDYNSTNLPPHTLSYSGWLNTALFHGSIGGTYTFSYQLYCPNENATSTITISCETSPVVNAGDDRVVSLGTLGQNNQEWSQWPAIRLYGQASDVNEANLIFSWKFVGLPLIPHSNVTIGEPLLDLANDRHAIFYPLYPGDYTLELAVFDGCSIAKDTVTITLACDNCLDWTLSTNYVFGDLIFSYANNPQNFFTSYHSDYIWEQVDYNYDNTIEYYYSTISVSHVSNSNGYYAEYSEPFYYQAYFDFYQATTDDLVNITTTTSSTNTSNVNTVTNPAPLTNNIRTWRYEGHSIVDTTIVTTQDATVTTYLYNTLASKPHKKCQLSYYGPHYTYSEVSVSGDYNFNNLYPFDTTSDCIGTYYFDKVIDTDCTSRNKTQTVTLTCGRAPVAYLTTCTKSLPYNYNTGTFPTFALDAKDTIIWDVAYNSQINQNGYVLMRYEYTSKPVESSLNQYITAPAQCTNNYITTVPGNAYVGCNAIVVTPDYGGSYTVKLTASNGCASTTATSTFTVVCDPLDAYVVGLSTIDSSLGLNYVDLAAIYTSNHTLSVQWSTTDAGVSFTAPTSFNTTVYFSTGGTYVLQVTVSDGCQQKVVSHTVSFTCGATITPSVSTAGSLLGPTLPYLFQIDASASSSSASLGLSFLWRLVSKPAFSNVPSTSYAAPGFVENPDLAGSYVYELTLFDGCRTVRTNYTFTTANCAGYFDSSSLAISILDQNSVTRTSFAWDGVGSTAPFSVTAQVNNVGLTPSWELSDDFGMSVTGNGNTFDVLSALNSVVGDHYVGNYYLSFWTYGPCSYATKKVAFSITCGRVPSITIPGATSTFAAGKFSRVSAVPTVTEDPARPFPSYLNSYKWWVTGAPTGSVFKPTTTYTVSQTITANTTTTTQISTNPELWEVVNTVNTLWVYETVDTHIQLDYDDTGDRRDACFTPDVDGPYTLMFEMTGYCYDTLTATTTVTTSCNTQPTVPTMSSTTNYQNTYLGINAQVVTATATDADGDDLYYGWAWVSVPAESPTGNMTTFYTIGKDSVFFYPDFPGDWVIKVNVTDGCSSSEGTYTVTVTCASQPAIGFTQPSQTLTFDGYVPVTFKEFVLTASPGCTYSVNNLQLVDFVPSGVIPPPPATTTGDALSSASSVVASVALLLAMIALLL